ncbi:membrane protein [Clostridia bacterium]|nr:membrane protein [Clostridia bacterium]
MNRIELKQAARNQIRGNIGILFLCSIVVTAVSGVSNIFSIVVVPPITVGFSLLYFRLTQGDKPRLQTLFDGFSLLVPCIVLYFLKVLYVFLWSLLLIVPGIIKAISLSMSEYILAEHQDYTAKDALNESARIMNGHKMEYFILQLSFILWGMLTAVTCGLAGIYVVPYINATNANFYNSIK